MIMYKIDSVSLNCNGCGHRNICKLKDSFIALQTRLNPHIYDAEPFRVIINCDHYSADSKPLQIRDLT